jgi:very-short-patch-repair endonuclease
MDTIRGTKTTVIFQQVQTGDEMTSISLAEYKKLYGGGRKTATKRSKKTKGEKVVSEGESTLSLQLKALKIEFEQEFKFHQKRKWKTDFHIVGQKILVEVEGGIWSGGRHTRGKGYIGDMEKYNSATMMGYQVIRFSTEQVKSGLAIKQIEKMVGDLG